MRYLEAVVLSLLLQFPPRHVEFLQILNDQNFEEIFVFHSLTLMVQAVDYQSRVDTYLRARSYQASALRLSLDNGPGTHSQASLQASLSEWTK